MADLSQLSDAELFNAYAQSDPHGAASDFFMSRGWWPHQTAGIVGNLSHESAGMNPAAKGDNNASYGLGQWNGDRRQGLFQYAQSKGEKTPSFLTQLEYVQHELTGPKAAVGNELRQTRTIGDATRLFSDKFEIPGRPMMESRLSKAFDVAAKLFSPSEANAATMPQPPAVDLSQMSNEDLAKAAGVDLSGVSNEELARAAGVDLAGQDQQTTQAWQPQPDWLWDSPILQGEGDKVARQYLETPVNAQNIDQFVSQTIPKSAARLAYGAARAPLDIAHSIAYPGELQGQQPDYANMMDPVAQMPAAPFVTETAKGAAEFSGKPLGLYGMEEFKQAWKERPVESLAGVFPLFKAARELKGVGGVDVSRLDAAIDRGINKSIRPAVGGMTTDTQVANYMDRARTAVKTIVANKDNLALTDEFGEAAGGLPQNLKQFAQSIDQTKSTIFEHYNKMAVEAGEKGATVNLESIAQHLDPIINDKALQTVNPQASEYAATMAERLMSSQEFTATEAQHAIQALNAKLQSVKDYDSVSKAYVDSVVVNNLRKTLDTAIETTTGPGYQDLKNTYGSLRTIERDVNRRSIVDARKNVKGLIDFSDIFSGSQAVHGILSMNPSVMGSAVAAKWISQHIKRLNDPNRIVRNMFGDVDKALASTKAKQEFLQSLSEGQAD